jgi:hypothetical protein
MYGPVATTCVLYVEGSVPSKRRAYSSGTGAAAASVSAPSSVAAVGRRSRKTIVRASGAVIPEMSGTPLTGADGAPTIPLKYDWNGLVTAVLNSRSIAYLTSVDRTSRSTGGE